MAKKGQKWPRFTGMKTSHHLAQLEIARPLQQQNAPILTAQWAQDVQGSVLLGRLVQALFVAMPLNSIQIEYL